jgi:hypothetical protein
LHADEQPCTLTELERAGRATASELAEKLGARREATAMLRSEPMFRE